MLTIGIIGATGYTGIMLLRLLQRHPAARVTVATSDASAGQPLSSLHPSLPSSILLEKLSVTSLITHCDLIFIALPHGHAVNIVPVLLAAGKKVIDLGADFRLKTAIDYEAWYQHPAAPAALLEKAVYGLPELGDRVAIANASLIANPGCYPTASLLAIMPALRAGLVDSRTLVIDAKSGISGAGRAPTVTSLYGEVSENVRAYQLAGVHRHTPEIEQALSVIANEKIIVQFTPHVVPVIRGLLATVYCNLTTSLAEKEIIDLYRATYANEPFIKVLDTLPEMQFVRDTNECHVGLRVDERTRRLIIVSVIDNLGKGAAGQAIQNTNLLYGFSETTGLQGE